MTNQQLELGFNSAQSTPPPARRQTRIARASWWFGQMRQIVDRAMDWQSVGDGRSEQTWLAGTHREVRI